MASPVRLHFRWQGLPCAITHLAFSVLTITRSISVLKNIIITPTNGRLPSLGPVSSFRQHGLTDRRHTDAVSGSRDKAKATTFFFPSITSAALVSVILRLS